MTKTFVLSDNNVLISRLENQNTTPKSLWLHFAFNGAKTYWSSILIFNFENVSRLRYIFVGNYGCFCHNIKTKTSVSSDKNVPLLSSIENIIEG